MEQLTVKSLYNLKETIARDIFEGVTYPWEVLPKISSFILELGETLSEEEYEKVGENVWIAKSATVAPTAVPECRFPYLLHPPGSPPSSGIRRRFPRSVFPSRPL